MESEKKPQNSLFAKQEIEYGDSTQTLAVVNLDWEIISSQHLFKFIQPILVHQSNLVSVEIFLTKDGEEEIKYEEENGPRIKSDNNDTNDAIRDYLIKKRGYYIGIIRFRTIEEAEHVYNSLDGVEIAETGNYMDLRFIKDDYIERKLTKAVCKTSKIGENVEVKLVTPNNNDLFDDNLECDWENGRKREAFIESLFENEEFDSDQINELIDLSESNDENIVAKRKNKKVGKSSNKSDKNKEKNDIKRKDKEKKSREKDKTDKKKAKRQKENKLDDIGVCKEEENVKIDLNDERFAGVLKDDDFNIDITHRLFKTNSGLVNIVKEKRKKYKEEE